MKGINMIPIKRSTVIKAWILFFNLVLLWGVAVLIVYVMYAFIVNTAAQDRVVELDKIKGLRVTGVIVGDAPEDTYFLADELRELCFIKSHRPDEWGEFIGEDIPKDK
jgi:hypothetical protein